MTSSDMWGRIEELFAQVLEMESRARLAFLQAVSAEEPAVHAELVRLLAAHDSAGDFLTTLDAERGAALLRPSAADETAQVVTIGSYRLVRRLGGGGMGVVYLGYDASLDRPVALKLLHPRRAVTAQVRQLLFDEAKAAGALDHPNIAPVHEVGETDDGQVFIAMTFCEGESLTERIARGPVKPREAARIARQIADALSAAHRRGIIHRDIKPGNVMISPDGWVRLVDFGIALVAGRDPDNGIVSGGTRGYMSPEQLSGEPVDRRTDVWSLGVVLFEALTGRAPFRSDRWSHPGSIEHELAESLRDLRSSAPQPLARIVERCLAIDPAHRLPGAAAVVEELDAYLNAEAAAPADSRAGTEHKQATRPVKWRRILLPVAGAALVTTIILIGQQQRQADTTISGANAVLAILPFSPIAEDSALRRLGRELVVTLGSSLDGAGGLRVAEPLTVLGQTDPRVDLTLEAAAGLAQRLGASQMLGGRITLSGGSVRLDAVVHDVQQLAVLGRYSAEADPGDLSGLSDRLAAELLRNGWEGLTTGGAPNPGALTTRSLPALRAFLEGELDMSAGRFRAAPQAFERAIHADSTFWFAYWRYMYALGYHGVPVDPGIIQKVMAHRFEFPDADRLLIETSLESSIQKRVDQLREIANRFPVYWQAAFALGDALTHHGSYLGEPVEESLAALQRTTELNPLFVPAWEHYFWRAVQARDTARSRVILARLEEFPLDSAHTDRPDLEILTYYRYLNHLARSGDQPRAAESEIGVRVLSAYGGSMAPERMAANFTIYGFFRAQLDVSQRIIRTNARPAILAAHTWGIALAHAARGDWDSAFAASRRYARMSTHPTGPMWAYGLAATGAWLGELHPDSAGLLRDHALRSEFGSSDDGRAEVAWLDGLMACTRGDAAALRDAHARLAGYGASAPPLLAMSLHALEDALNGRRIDAARSIAAAEAQNADAAGEFGSGASHPFLNAVNRLAAAKWLLEAGDTAQTLRLLLLHETNLPASTHPLQAVNVILASVAFSDLARIEAARGQHERARQYRARLAELDKSPAVTRVAARSAAPRSACTIDWSRPDVRRGIS